MISLLLLAGCVASTGLHDQSDCPPDSTRVMDEDTGMYDCADEEDFEEIRRALEERI